MKIVSYDREAAVRYAHQWAYQRNPRFYDYEEIGGDCTNFASQCLFAGTGIMNFMPVYGWYYLNANEKAPAWTGVPYFYNFITRKEENTGPFGEEADMNSILPGDFVQLSFSGENFAHTLIVVEVGETPALENVLVAAHSQDADYRPLSTYPFQQLRFLHIQGARPPEELVEGENTL